MPSRTLYVGQEVKITCNNTGVYRYLPVQSASAEVSRPIEDILSFGHLGSLGRFQTAVSTCKSDIKSYIADENSSNNAIDAEFISQLTGEALQGQVSVVTVTPNGFTLSGILSSFGCEISNGGFATADLSFAGVGEPLFASAPTGSTFSEKANMPASFTPVTSSNVSGNITSGCANSFKFSLDLPTEQLSCLGGQVTGGQAAIANDFLMLSKPPFKATITVEGTSVEPPSVLTSAFIIGKLSITLPAGRISSQSFNNAVGNVGATYNYVLEDVSATFADL